MKKAAAKRRRRLFFLAAVLVLAAAFLVTVPAEATRTYNPPITAALEQPRLSLKMQERITERAERQAENRFRLFEDLSLPPHPLEWVLARKTASGIFDLGIGCNTRKTGGLVQNCSGPSFQGLWTDPTTGLSYARNRWYDARTASWLSEDPAGAIDSPNLYAFVGWAPHMGRDPLGLLNECADDDEECIQGELAQLRDAIVAMRAQGLSSFDQGSIGGLRDDFVGLLNQHVANQPYEIPVTNLAFGGDWTPRKEIQSQIELGKHFLTLPKRLRNGEPGAIVETGVLAAAAYLHTSSGKRFATRLSSKVGPWFDAVKKRVRGFGPKSGTAAGIAARTAAGSEGVGAYEKMLAKVDGLDFTTPPNKAVFYSGLGQRARAMAYAEKTGGMTIDMTRGGQDLVADPIWAELTPGQRYAVWEKASTPFAQSASGTIEAFIKGARSTRVFRRIEEPLLNLNSNVYKYIYHY